MKKPWVILLTIAILSLFGCNDGNFYEYKGENQDWTAELRLKQLDGEVKKEFILVYKGEAEELSSVKEISYRYETPTFNSGKTTQEYLTDGPRDKVFKKTSKEEGKLFAEEDDVITVEVEVDGVKEIFKLKN
ncbi:hypothetical protein DOE78_13760 [Bacillus sp. Y1]|nr:hypothetical protein [Bacillus sp. Y1]AYA76422.1 hypothetical protein DOE78_13760 [Bacillus sp. Y1]